MHKIRNKGTGKLKNFIKACVPALILLILWQLAFLSGKWSAYVLPGPEKVWKSFVTMTGNGTLLKHVLVSFKRVLTGFSISFVCAFCLGMIAALRSGSLLWSLCGIYAQCAAHQFDRSFDPVVWDWRDIQDHHYCIGVFFSHVYEHPKRPSFL